MFLDDKEMALAVVTCEKALMSYGARHQLSKIKEECLELIEVVDWVSGDRENTAGLECFADELADVYIMALQGAMMVGIDKVRERIRFKVERLEKRIEAFSKEKEDGGSKGQES